MLPLCSMQHATRMSPFSSAFCDTSTSSSILCTCTASCPGTQGSYGHAHSTQWGMPLQHALYRATQHGMHCTATNSTDLQQQTGLCTSQFSCPDMHASEDCKVHNQRAQFFKTRTSIRNVVTSESWLMASGSPHRNEKITCRDRQCSAMQACDTSESIGKPVLRVSSRPVPD